MKLTKAGIIRQVRKQNKGTSYIQATETVDAFFRISKNSLINGSDLLLSGFGKFSLRNKNSRIVRNFQTGEELILDARLVVRFSPSEILRGKVNRQ